MTFPRPRSQNQHNLSSPAQPEPAQPCQRIQNQHNLSPPEAYSLRCAIQNPKPSLRCAIQNPKPSLRHAIQSVPDSSHSGLVVMEAARRYIYAENAVPPKSDFTDGIFVDYRHMDQQKIIPRNGENGQAGWDPLVGDGVEAEAPLRYRGAV
jgi:hypothetical protein